MNRTVTSIILIVISAIVFFVYIDPQYKEVKALAAESDQFDEALARARELQSVRDDLLSRYNTFSTEDIERVGKLLPDNVDNVRLILDLDGIASQYGIVVRDLEFSNEGSESRENVGASEVRDGKSKLGEIEISFEVSASYEDFKRFLKDLEQSLRIVDVTGLRIVSRDSDGLLDFDLSIKTYWLK